MFTGIITEQGEIRKISKAKDKTTFVIQAKNILKNKKQGDSIAVNGACLTITKISKNKFECDAITETLKKTNLEELKEDNLVNLENPLTLNQPIDGHLVQGHIDTTAPVENHVKTDENSTLTIKLLPEIKKYIALKGSVTINGVSLTISDLASQTFSVSLIPYTLENTNLGKLKKGNKVNIEIDLIARYLKRLLDAKDKESTYEFLKERGFI